MRNEKGQFIKGNIPWSKENKGSYSLQMPEGHGENVSLGKIKANKKYSLDQRRNISNGLRGRKLSIEHGKKVIKNLKFGLVGEDNLGWKGGRPKCLKCKKAVAYKAKFCLEHRLPPSMEANRKNSLTHIERRELHPNWKGGITKHPKYASERARKRKLLKLNAEGSHSEEDWQNLKEKFQYLCLCCKKQAPFVELTRDHIMPLSLGGSDNIENIQPLCRGCNSIKRIKTTNYIKDYV